MDVSVNTTTDCTHVKGYWVRIPTEAL